MYQRKDRERDLFDTQPNKSFPKILSEIEAAIRDGNSRNAYELSLQATLLEPENIEGWLVRASLAPSLEERVICANRLNELAPDHRDRHNVAFFALKDSLDHDPFLAYLGETEDLYRVINGGNVVLSIPKKRAMMNLFEQSGKLRTAYRWLVLAILGLLLAGVGTVLFAPLAALTALQAGQASSRAERVSSMVVLIVAVLLFIIGSVFTILFLVHWTG